MTMLVVDVVGLPAPQGSKSGFYNKATGRVQMVESSKKVKPWRQDVVASALNVKAETGWAAPAGPVEVQIVFHMPRPKYHFGSGARAHLLKPGAPVYVDKKPDIDKLVRSTLDALTSADVLRDDAQVGRLVIDEVYANGPTGARITITPLMAHMDSVAAAATPTVQEALL
jgi:Holliday junction resolvase RusA-like endonuclease